MTTSVLIERRDDGLYVSFEEEFGTTTPARTPLNEEQLHDELCRQGYLRVGAAKDDVIAGLYVRKAVA